MRQLHIVSAVADRELDAVRGILAAFEAASGFADVIDILRARAAAGDRAEALDMIGHSGPLGFLVLGSWVIDDSPQTAASFSEMLCPLLGALGIRTIRLLGCSTAGTERGRSAMRNIAWATECAVVGTRGYVSKLDYTGAGFQGDDTLMFSPVRSGNQDQMPRV